MSNIDNLDKDGRRGLSRRGFVGAAGAVALTASSFRSAKALPTDSALALAEKYRPELQELLLSMIGVQRLSGESAAEAQEIVKAYLSGLPYRIDESADRPSRYRNHEEYMDPNPPGDGPFVNVVGWPLQESQRKHAMFSHIDTHVLAKGWDTEPLSPVVRGSRILL